jgi:hypothetical protein
LRALLALLCSTAVSEGGESVSNTIIYAACGALAGAVGAGLGALLTARAGPKAKRVVPGLFVVIALALNHAVVAPAAVEAWADGTARTPELRFARLVSREAEHHPALARYLRAQQSSRKTGTQAFAESAALSAKGMLRLDHAQLVRRAQILAGVVLKVDEGMCSMMGFGGAATRADADRLLGAFTDDELREWAALTSLAMERELVKSPPSLPPLSQDQVAALIEDLDAEDPGAFVALAVKANAPEATNADRCALTKALYQHVSRLEGQKQLDFAVLMATQE